MCTSKGVAIVKATLRYGAGDVRIETIPDARLLESTDALVRVTHAAICGSDLWPYKLIEQSETGSSGDTSSSASSRQSVQTSARSSEGTLWSNRLHSPMVIASSATADSTHPAFTGVLWCWVGQRGWRTSRSSARSVGRWDTCRAARGQR